MRFIEFRRQKSDKNSKIVLRKEYIYNVSKIYKRNIEKCDMLYNSKI